MPSLKIRYFAVFREQSGMGSEVIDSAAATPEELYAELRERNGFSLDPKLVRVAVNGTYVPMDSPLAAGDEVVLIPPVAGG